MTYYTVTRLISKEILDHIKETKQTYHPEYSVEEVDGILWEDRKLSFKIDLLINRNKEDFNGNYFIDGRVNKSYNTILVDVFLNPINEELYYQEVLIELNDIIRHEIQHLTQKGKNKKPFRVKPTSLKIRCESINYSRFEYGLLPDEIEAMVCGLKNKAKYTKKPIKYIFIKQLLNWKQLNEITKIESKQLYKIWCNHLDNIWNH